MPPRPQSLTWQGVLVGNVAARIGALGCVFAATLLLAHDGGAAVVGVYALFHVLPGLVGTIASCGLPVAAPYFLAGPDRHDPRLRLTLVSMTIIGGVAGATLWIVAAPLFGPVVFPDLSVGLVMLAGLAVPTRLFVITAKACSQGSNDLKGSNAVIFLEQLMFLPTFVLLSATGVAPFPAVVVGLMLADVTTGSIAWGRLARRHFFRGQVRGSFPLARRIAAFGTRGQVGGVMSLLNLRLDFVLLSAFAGPAVLGVYAVASKFAELVRILGMALQYVLYPKFASDGVRATRQARGLIVKAGLLTASGILPLWVACGFVIPAFYGSQFESAVTPTRIILLGLAFDGLAGVITAVFYGVGRPGLNSLAMGAGLAATLVLDLILIPRFAEVGAAVASAVAYTTTGLVLIWFFVLLERSGRQSREPREPDGSAPELPQVASSRT
jgi:O-antigen/teichoic acid export membrane protein